MPTGYNFVAARPLKIGGIQAFNPGQLVPDSTVSAQGWVTGADVAALTAAQDAPGPVIPVVLWAANTAYSAGVQVVNPTGQIVAAPTGGVPARATYQVGDGWILVNDTSGGGGGGGAAIDDVGSASASTVRSSQYVATKLAAGALPAYTASAVNRFDPNASAYNVKASNTRKLRAGLARARTGTSGKSRWLRTGASISMGLSAGGDTFSPNQNGPSKYLRDALAAAGYPVTSTGWVTCSLDGSGLGRKDSRWAFAGGFAANPSNYFVVAQASGATATFTTDVAGSQVDLLVVGSSGAMTYKINGGAATAMTLSGVYALQKVTVAATVAVGDAITVTATTAGVTLLAAVRVSNPSVGLEVSAVAVSGSASPAWRSDADPIAGLGSVWLSTAVGEVPDCVFVGLDPVVNTVWGGSNAAADASVTAAMADIAQQAGAYKTYGADVVLVLPHQINPAAAGTGGGVMTATRWNTVAAAAYALADSLDVPLLDMTDRVGNYASATAAGYLSDGAHGHAALYAVDGQLTALGALTAAGPSDGLVAQLATKVSTVNGKSPTAGALTLGPTDVSAAPALTPGYDVVLEIGQSNMRGGAADYDAVRYDMADPNVYQWAAQGSSYYGTISQAITPLDHPSITSEQATPGLGPGEGFARRWRLQHPDRRVLHVPSAWGGTALVGADSQGFGNTWDPAATGPLSLLQRAIRQTTAALARAGSNSQLVAILWHQGEQDIVNSTPSATYQTKLLALIDALRAQFGATVPFVIGQLLPEGGGASGNSINQVHQAIPGLRANTAFVFGPSGCVYASPHYNAKGQRQFGGAYYEAYLRALTNNPAGTTPTPALAVPAQVTNLRNDAAANTTTGIPVTFDPQHYVNQWTWRYRVAGSGGAYTTPSALLTSFASTLSGLSPSTSYEIQVAGVNQAGTGAWSATLTASTVAGSAITPTLATSGLIRKLEADAISPQTDQAAVTSWADTSGAGNNLASTAGGTPIQPTLNLNRINGLASVITNGSNYLDSSTPAATAIMTRIIVCKLPTVPGGSAGLLGGTSTTVKQEIFALTGTGIVGRAPTTQVVGSSTLDTNFHAIGGRFTGDATANLRVDSNKTVGSMGSSANTGCRIGASNSGTKAAIEVQAIYEWSRALTDSEWDNAFAYIAQRTGISV